MKPFDWNVEKNNWLRLVRRVTFEDVIFHLQAGDLLDVIQHDKYAHQRVLVVNIEEYVYLVPFVESDEAIFLKTVIPSRKMTKRYLGATDHEAD